MKQAIRTVTDSCPPFVLFLGGVILAVGFGLAKLAAVLESVREATPIGQ